jgi:hypothetical protein
MSPVSSDSFNNAVAMSQSRCVRQHGKSAIRFRETRVRQLRWIGIWIARMALFLDYRSLRREQAMAKLPSVSPAICPVQDFLACMMT